VVEPYPSEKYELISWGYDIPKIWKNNPVMFQTTNQIFSCFSRGIQAEIMETSMVVSMISQGLPGAWWAMWIGLSKWLVQKEVDHQSQYFMGFLSMNGTSPSLGS